MKVLSQRIGHATVAVTMGVYSARAPGDDEAAASATVGPSSGLLSSRTKSVPFGTKSLVGRRGDAGNRTRVQGFAGPCLSHSATSPGRPAGRAAAGHPSGRAGRPARTDSPRCGPCSTPAAPRPRPRRTSSRRHSDPCGNVTCTRETGAELARRQPTRQARPPRHDRRIVGRRGQVHPHRDVDERQAERRGSHRQRPTRPGRTGPNRRRPLPLPRRRPDDRVDHLTDPAGRPRRPHPPAGPTRSADRATGASSTSSTAVAATTGRRTQHPTCHHSCTPAPGPPGSSGGPKTRSEDDAKRPVTTRP